MGRSMERSRSRRNRSRSAQRPRHRGRSRSHSHERSSRRRSHSRSTSRGHSRRYDRENSHRREHSASRHSRERRHSRSRSRSYEKRRRDPSPRRESERRSPRRYESSRGREDRVTSSHSRDDVSRSRERSNHNERGVETREVKQPREELDHVAKPSDMEHRSAFTADRNRSSPGRGYHPPTPSHATSTTGSEVMRAPLKVPTASPSIASTTTTPSARKTPPALFDQVKTKRQGRREEMHRTYLKSSAESNRAEMKYLAMEADLVIAEYWMELMTKNLEDVGRRIERQDWNFKKIEEGIEMDDLMTAPAAVIMEAESP